jgi:hypothetical protein
MKLIKQQKIYALVKGMKIGELETTFVKGGKRYGRIKWTQHPLSKSIRFNGRKYFYKDFPLMDIRVFNTWQELKEYKNKHGIK